jgi:hypothetical protein
LKRSIGVAGWLTAWVLAGAIVAPPGMAEVFPVPDDVRRLREPREELHVLRSPAGAALGEQRYRAVVEGDRLRFDIETRFASGEEWEEHGEMDLAHGFRSRRFAKTVRRAGAVVAEQQVDFTTGKVEWLAEGVRAERTLTFAPDTYIGPMLAVVLAGVSEKRPAATSFQALVFRPDPEVFTLRAEAVGEEDRPVATTKLRVKADLGPVQNVMFASLIPTHYFWFTRAPSPAFVAFEGALGNGLEVVMTPERDLSKTARAD